MFIYNTAATCLFINTVCIDLFNFEYYFCAFCSTDSGWDNPFRPGGDLSREADEIVSMIRGKLYSPLSLSLLLSLMLSFFCSFLGGKPITPTEDRTIGNGNAQHDDDNCNGGSTAIGESVTKTNVRRIPQIP